MSWWKSLFPRSARPSRMALRIYVIGLVQFLIVAVVMEADHRSHEAARRAALAEEQATLTEHRPSPRGPGWEGQGRFVAAGLARVIDSSDSKALQQELDRVADAFFWSVEVSDPEGHSLAHAEPSGVGPKITRPGPSERTTTLPVPLANGREAHFAFTPHGRGGPPGLGGPGGPGSGPGGPPGPGGPAFGGPPGPGGPRPGGPPFGLAVAVILVVVGVSSWLTARSFARPLASLATTTRAFGRGELDARAKMERVDEIGEVAQAFDDMADRIAKLLLAERELLANVSHELRTPLARIRVALDLASEADPRTAIESFVEIAQDLAELERIVDDVLASARLALDAGSSSSSAAILPVRAERIETNALLERSAARFKSAHPKRPFDVDLADALPPIDADAVLMRRVIDNLLDNANKYSDRPDAPITLRALEEKGAVVIEVEDKGIGISAEDQQRLFEPFFRVDRSRTRATGGLGLGLVLARRVVEAHGGSLTIESGIGKGTCARVRLPGSRT